MTLFSLNSVASTSSARSVAAAKAPGSAATAGTAPSQASNRGADAVELSGLYAPSASTVNNAAPGSSKPIRSDLVARIKSQIDSGTYDLDSKKLDKVATGILRDINLLG